MIGGMEWMPSKPQASQSYFCKEIEGVVVCLCVFCVGAVPVQYRYSTLNIMNDDVTCLSLASPRLISFIRVG